MYNYTIVAKNGGNMTNQNIKKDIEWQKILDELNINIPIKNTGDFKQNYFDAMKTLIKKIKANKYIEVVNEENKNELKHDLYNLGCLFYGYRHKINSYYMEYDKENYNKEFVPKWETLFGYLPTSHNYNAYLNRLTPALYEHYYLLQIGVIEEFINNNGQQPKYLYELYDYQRNRFWFVAKLELFTKEDIPNSDNLNLPHYYPINTAAMTIEEYEEYYKKHSLEKYFPNFKKYEFPIKDWISKHRKNENWDMERIPNDVFMMPKVKIINHLRLNVKKDEIVYPKDFSYYYGIPESEVISILDTVCSSDYYIGKIEKITDKSGTIAFLKKENYEQEKE